MGNQFSIRSDGVNWARCADCQRLFRCSCGRQHSCELCIDRTWLNEVSGGFQVKSEPIPTRIGIIEFEPAREKRIADVTQQMSELKISEPISIPWKHPNDCECTQCLARRVDNEKLLQNHHGDNCVKPVQVKTEPIDIPKSRDIVECCSKCGWMGLVFTKDNLCLYCHAASKRMAQAAK